MSTNLKSSMHNAAEGIKDSVSRLNQSWERQGKLNVERMQKITELSRLNNDLKEGYMNSIYFIVNLSGVFKEIQETIKPIAESLKFLNERLALQESESSKIQTEDIQKLNAIDALINQNLTQLNTLIRNEAERVNNLATTANIQGPPLREIN